MQQTTSSLKTLSATGLSIAAAAATLFAAAGFATVAQAADGDMGKVKCSGINGCKGSSECKTAKSECKGHNSCKGQGWVSKKTAEECTKEGGKVLK
ncbi:BufA2 family periplasmic bufferin-type metallophore [Roseateles sp. PN1]|uniref:BufA2 family periplasmic bufferin-type metallophore n=1 Tax=Roseateles sp. PN1 TaxID=3137372 RepID=UPI003138FC16